MDERVRERDRGEDEEGQEKLSDSFKGAKWEDAPQFLFRAGKKTTKIFFLIWMAPIREMARLSQALNILTTTFNLMSRTNALGQRFLTLTQPTNVEGLYHRLSIITSSALIIERLLLARA